MLHGPVSDGHLVGIVPAARPGPRRLTYVVYFNLLIASPSQNHRVRDSSWRGDIIGNAIETLQAPIIGFVIKPMTLPGVCLFEWEVLDIGTN